MAKTVCVKSTTS